MSLNSASPNPRCVADFLGLGSLADGELGMDPDLLRQLYRHARGDDGKRCLFDSDTTFVTGWINLDSTRARELISAFVPLDDAENLKEARRAAQTNLEAQAWNDLLGIETPPICCKVKIHGTRWGLRFQSAEPAMRGCETINEGLPPIPTCGAEPATTPPVNDSRGSGATIRPPAVPGSSSISAAENALRRGGLPT